MLAKLPPRVITSTLKFVKSLSRLEADDDIACFTPSSVLKFVSCISVGQDNPT